MGQIELKDPVYENRMLLKKNWVLVFSFMYLVSVDPMDRSYIIIIVFGEYVLLLTAWLQFWRHLTCQNQWKYHEKLKILWKVQCYFTTTFAQLYIEIEDEAFKLYITMYSVHLYWSLQCLYFLLIEDSIILWPIYISPKNWKKIILSYLAMIWNQKNGIKNWTPNVGLEPTTLRLRVSCSTNWASRDWWREREYRKIKYLSRTGISRQISIKTAGTNPPQ